MPTEGDEKRLRLFDTYSGNFTAHKPEVRGIFFCPICVRSFSRGAALGPAPAVNIAHVYPEASGGKAYTLECTDCNSRMNKMGDAELSKRHRHWEISKPGGSGTVRCTWEHQGHTIKFDWTNSPTGAHVHTREANNNPLAFRTLVSAFLNNVPVKAKFPTTDDRKINMAVLHSVHLLLFKQFAYGYLLTPLGDSIRTLLIQSEVFDRAPFLSMDIPTSAGITPSMAFRVGNCQIKNGPKCLFVGLPCPEPENAFKFILLPGPRREDQTAYDAVRMRADQWVDATYQTFGDRPWQQLLAPEYTNYLLLGWDGWKEHNIDKHKIMQAIYAEASGQIDADVETSAVRIRFGMREPYTVATIAPPSSGSKDYRLRILATDLQQTHRLLIRETYAGAHLVSDLIANGQANELIEVDVVINHDDPAVVVAVRDEAALSTAAAWRWDLYDTRPAGAGGGDSTWTTEEKDAVLGQMRGTNRRVFALMVKAFDAQDTSDAQELADVIPDSG